MHELLRNSMLCVSVFCLLCFAAGLLDYAHILFWLGMACGAGISWMIALILGHIYTRKKYPDWQPGERWPGDC